MGVFVDDERRWSFRMIRSHASATHRDALAHGIGGVQPAGVRNRCHLPRTSVNGEILTISSEGPRKPLPPGKRSRRCAYVTRTQKHGVNADSKPSNASYCGFGMR